MASSAVDTASHMTWAVEDANLASDNLYRCGHGLGRGSRPRWTADLARPRLLRSRPRLSPHPLFTRPQPRPWPPRQHPLPRSRLSRMCPRSRTTLFSAPQDLLLHRRPTQIQCPCLVHIILRFISPREVLYGCMDDNDHGPYHRRKYTMSKKVA